jgi:hypothetical protein
MSTRKVARRLGLGALVAWVLGGAAAGHAQVSVRVEVGRHHPGGSIRYGTPPPRVVPAVPPAAVRYEHYRFNHPAVVWTPPHWGRYRNPYPQAYWRRFRPGYRTVVIGPTQYYAYPAMPAGYQTVVVNGVTYYVQGGVYYQPYIDGGQTVYVVVPSPIP